MILTRSRGFERPRSAVDSGQPSTSPFPVVTSTSNSMITALTVPYSVAIWRSPAVGDPEHKVVPRRIEACCPYQGDTPARVPSGGWGIGNCQPFAIKNVFVSDERSPTLNDRASPRRSVRDRQRVFVNLMCNAIEAMEVSLRRDLTISAAMVDKGAVAISIVPGRRSRRRSPTACIKPS